MAAPIGNQYGVGFGRPSSYREEYDEQVHKLCLLGATEEQIADFFKISVPTLYAWRERHISFLKAIEDGKLGADANVANSLYHRATGFERPAVKIFAPNFADGPGEPVYAPYTEYYPPDTNAASLWLRNRQPKIWRDKREQEVVLRTIPNPKDLTDDELRRALVDAGNGLVIEHQATAENGDEADRDQPGYDPESSAS